MSWPRPRGVKRRGLVVAVGSTRASARGQRPRAAAHGRPVPPTSPPAACASPRGECALADLKMVRRGGRGEGTFSIAAEVALGALWRRAAVAPEEKATVQAAEMAAAWWGRREGWGGGRGQRKIRGRPPCGGGEAQSLRRLLEAHASSDAQRVAGPGGRAVGCVRCVPCRRYS